MVNRDWRRVAAGPGLALAALAALAISPLVRAGYPTIGDGLNHFYRLVEFEHLLQHGVWFPRWATDLGYGYGYPLFIFTPPLAYYLGTLFRIFGLSDANSLLAVYVCAWLLAASGAYRLAREHGGPAAGLLAAAAYALAPYLYFNSLARGALPETLGLGLLPWVLWACYRLALRPSRFRLLGAALVCAALVLVHLLTALLALPLIILFWLIARLNRTTLKPGSAGKLPLTNYQVPLALLLALALSAYFVIPAVLETGDVQIGQLTQPGDLDYHNNFLSLGQLLAWPQPFDARLVFREVPPSLSLAALALAAFGLARRAWRTRRAAPALEAWDVGLWLGLISLNLLTLNGAAPIWEPVPGAGLIQFPWRLVGPASLLLALLVARAVDINPGTQGAALPIGLGPALALAGLFAYSLTWTFSSGPPAPAAAGVRNLAGYERSSGQLGTTSTGEFLPRAVSQLPDPLSLEAAYALHSVIDRLGPPPPGVTVEAQTATVTSASASVSAPAPARLTFNLFDFPGWQATVDGQPLPITASQPNGLITVPIPAGRHTVQVAFASIPLRTAASLVSFVALGLAAWVAASQASGRLHTPALLAKRPEQSEWAYPDTTAFALTALALLALRLVAIDGRDTLFAHSRFDGERVTGVSQAFDANFQDQLVLIGLDLPGSRVPADGALTASLYWRAQNVPAVDYSTTVQVLDDEGNLWGQSDSQNPGRLPTSRWGPGQYARDAHALRLLPGTPPGRYNLVAGVYRVGGAALSVLDANRVPQGQTVSLGALTVTRAQRPRTAIDVPQPAAVALGPLTYLGDGLSAASLQAGDELRLELFWRAEGASRPDVVMHLALVGAGGELIQAWDALPARADYPASNWAQGEIVRSVQRLRVPANAPAGRATLQLSLRPAGASASPTAGPIPIAAVSLTVPVRSFQVPAMAHMLHALLGRSVELLGYDLNPDGVTLYWRAVEAMNVSYTAFVHALDAGDNLIGQVDEPPLKGTRPTTGWLPGEVLADRYTIPLAGARSLEVGLYDSRTLQRLGTIKIALPP